jgi:hypothetical protein
MAVTARTTAGRTYSEGPSIVNGDELLSSRFYTYRSDAGFVAGESITVNFTLDSGVAAVWPYASDWNTWMNGGSFYYSGVLGELEGQTFSLSLKPNDTEMPHYYTVEKVIPEHLIVISQPIMTDDDLKIYPLPGYGGASGGYHVFMLAEHEGKTLVSVYMEHESVMARGADADTITQDEALAPWRDALEAALGRWRDDFIPTLKKVVADGAAH